MRKRRPLELATRIATRKSPSGFMAEATGMSKRVFQPSYRGHDLIIRSRKLTAMHIGSHTKVSRARIPCWKCQRV